MTYVEYVLNAARVAVRFGRCSGSSHDRTPVWRIGSSVGGLSTMYEIHACQPGSMCDLSSGACQHLGSRMIRPYEVIRIKFLVFIVNPSCPHYRWISMNALERRAFGRSQGNSSARFSKYLLPYRSVAIKVPALVSPIPLISKEI
jgi:hypothetical protein